MQDRSPIPSWTSFRWVRDRGRGGDRHDLDAATHDLAEDARGRRLRTMSGRDRLVSAGMGGLFVLAATAAAVLVPTERSPSPLTIGLLVLIVALASRIEFEVGAGSAVPTGLVLVPMLFVLPPGQVPVWAALGYVLGEVPSYLRRRAHAERTLVLLSGSWYALGPALVLGLAGERDPTWRDAPIYAAALGAQFAFDFGASALRDRLVHGVGLDRLVRYLGSVYVVDAALAPVGLLAAVAAVRRPVSAVALLPLLALIALFARERSARVDHALELSSAYRGTGRLAATIHEILSAETLESTLTKVADTLAQLVPHDGLELSEAGVPSALLLRRGETPRRDQPRATIAVPLAARGSKGGSVRLYRLGVGATFERGEAQLLEWFAGSVALAIENARIRDRLRSEAETDSLTGLFNHRAFHERLGDELDRRRPSGERVALLMLDVDDFKRVNDFHGHDVGDDVLARLANALRIAAREEDHVCRVGGEELAVIMPGAGADGAVALANRLRDHLAQDEIDAIGAITVSTGIAEAPQDAASARDLVARAEGAMMTAKACGKDQVVVYDGAALARPGDDDGVHRDESLRSLAHLKMLQSLAAKLNRLNDVRRIGRAIVDELQTLIDYHSCRVYVAVGELLVPVAFRGELVYAEETPGALTTRFGVGVTGKAAAERRSLLIQDVARCEFAVQIPGTRPVDESMMAVPLLYGSRTIGVVVVSKLGRNQFDHDDIRLLDVLAGHAAVAIENARLYEEVRQEAETLERDFVSTVEALANALEAKDAATSSHARAITDLALEVGRALDLDEATLKRLELGALLHDIGKIGIPSEILDKPGPLTAEERRIIETHTVLGERIIAPIERLAEVRPIVRHCHERWDGAGYPDGLTGDQIPLEARVIFVVDAYHAMTSDRPYRARLPEAEARMRLRTEAGAQFDPRIVDVFVDLLETRPADVELVA